MHRRIDVCIDASMDKCIDVCNVLDGIRHLYHRHLRGPKVLGFYVTENGLLIQYFCHFCPSRHAIAPQRWT